MCVKNFLKRKLNTGAMPDVEWLWNQISTFEYISFDIFDTLLKRNVGKPTDVFSYIEERTGYTDFKKKRIAAERKARERKSNQEVSLTEIYAEFASEKDRQRLLHQELKAEADFLTSNKWLMQLYEKCIAEQKCVFLISDMYLPSDFLIHILHREGIRGYQKLYISCEAGNAKASGLLFEEILIENHIMPKDLIHVGDSWKADYQKPREKGICAIHIPTYIRRDNLFFENSEKLSLNILNAFIHNTIPDTTNRYFRFGYEKFGPFLWGYTKWIYDTMTEKNIDKIYFFARDGFIMKQAFDYVNRQKQFHTFYLEVSRRSLRVPILWMDSSFDTVMNMLSPSKRFPISVLFDGVGLDIRRYADLLLKYGYNEEVTFDRKNVCSDLNLRNMYEEMRSDIESLSKQEYQMLMQYISQNDLHGKFAIVDIGWSGGMQRFLHQTLNRLKIEHEIFGCYTGVASYYRRNTDIVPVLDLNGYLFDFLHNENAVDLRNSFVGLFEMLFLERDGSVKNYTIEENGYIRAVRYPYEYMQNGKPTEEQRRIEQLQAGALAFVEKASKNPVLMGLDYSANELFKELYRTGTNPNREELQMFADFNFLDEGEINALAAPKSILYYTIHPMKLKNDFLKSRWKTGFMKRLFKLPLPYEKIYRQLLRLK